MKPSKEEFAKMLDNTTDVAKQLQLVFPDPRDAIMPLSLILVGLSKSIGMPKDTVVQLVEAVYKDMQEDTSDEEHPVH